MIERHESSCAINSLVALDDQQTRADVTCNGEGEEWADAYVFSPLPGEDGYLIGPADYPDVRFEVARKIVNRAADYGIPASDIVVDPLVMPIGAMGTAGRQVFALLRRLVSELGVNTTCGASNVSFGLPNRNTITGTFLAMAISNGMTSAIMNPLHPDVKAAIMAADVLAGNDRDCYAWIRENRDPNAAGGAREGRAGGGRRRRE
jgi:5-methyltetrahydrofolate--homocysteine methyltransferase